MFLPVFMDGTVFSYLPSTISPVFVDGTAVRITLVLIKEKSSGICVPEDFCKLGRVRMPWATSA